jgi:hypothetical protein
MSQKYGAKVHIFDTLLRHYFLSLSFIPKCPADVDYDNLLTPTLKSDTIPSFEDQSLSVKRNRVFIGYQIITAALFITMVYYGHDRG